jgi:hypothetical protein
MYLRSMRVAIVNPVPFQRQPEAYNEVDKIRFNAAASSI